MIKRWFMIFTCFLVIVLITACATNEEENAGANQNNNEEEQDWDNMEAEITVYGHLFMGDWEDRFEEHLNEKFPNYTFNFISAYDDSTEDGRLTVEELIATGTKIDIYTGAAGVMQQRFQSVGLEEPMNELMEKHGIDPEAFEAPYLDSSTIDGKIYMLPISNSGFVMYYNKALFDRFGLDHPTDGMTWDEAIELADEFTRNDGKQYAGLWYSPKHILRVNQKSLGFVDPDTNEPTVNTPEWNDFLSKLFREPMQSPGIQDRAKEKYFGHDDYRNDDVVGMYVYSTGWLRNYNAELPSDWEIVSVPTFDGDGIGVQPYADYWGLASTSGNKDAAMRVIKYVTGEEFQTHFSQQGYMTPLKSQSVRDEHYADIEGLDQYNLDAIFYNDLAPQRPITAFDEVVLEGPLHKDVIPEIVRGNMDVNSGLQLAHDNAVKEIEQELLRQQVGE